jgi:hypothetical protein
MILRMHTIALAAATCGLAHWALVLALYDVAAPW